MNCVEVATARSTAVYQPVRTTKRQCRFHPHRANCNLIQTKGLTKTFYHHYTTIDMRYCSVNGDPYYEWLLSDNKERRAQRFQNAYKSVCGVIVESEQGEIVRNLDEAGEIDTELIRMVMRYVYEYLENDKCGLNGHAKNDTVHDEAKVYVLFNEMYVQCLYSFRQCIVLPQEMYCLYKDGEEPIINEQFFFTTVPEYEDTIASQHIYKGFLVYNTVLTMMLKEKNPFNDNTKVISKVIESVGTCNGGVENEKKTRIKICGLKFGGETPGHLMCPPKEIVKLVYKYAKWRLNPKNYARYYGLLVDDRPKHQEYLREWSIFLNNFKTYFFPS
nr:VP1054 [Pieris rapae granulovirus]